MQSIHKIYTDKLLRAPGKRLLLAGISSVVVAVATGVVWLGVLVGVILLAYLYLVRPIFRSDSMGTMAKGLVMLILILCIVILLKAFVLEVYKVAGESMEDTLFDDDRIVVSKLNYGPLLPYMISNDNGRLQGIDEIERNDVVLFTLKSERAPILKRIVGVPGDTITIRDSQLFVGHQQVSDPALSKRMYRVWPNNIDSLYKRLVSEKSESYYDNGKNAWFALLNLEQAGNFETSSFIDSLRITSRFLSSSSKKIFHIETELQWDVDNIGPLLVPKKGLTIPLNENNYIIYHKTILLEEGSDLQYTNGEFTIDGEIATRYTFKYDYYYVLGDHFDRSLDSRQYGFIKREHVIGKAVLLLFRSGNTFYDGTFCKTLE